MSDSRQKTESVKEEQPDKGDTSGGEGKLYGQEGESEVSVLDFLLILSNNKRVIARVFLVFFFIGVTYALLAPEEFASEAKVVREAQAGASSLPGGLEGLSGGLVGGAVRGVLGSGTSGLRTTAFPEILKSREVGLAVARDTFQFPEVKEPVTFIEYVNKSSGWASLVSKYTPRLPLVKSKYWELGNKKRAIEKVLRMVSSSVNNGTGLMTITVRAGSPGLAREMVNSYIKSLTDRVQQIRTENVRSRLEFARRKLESAGKELRHAEDSLATFLERNKNPSTARLDFKRERLQRKVTFKEQLYSQIQKQYTQAQLELERKKPVLTVAESPSSQTTPVSPSWGVVMVISIQ
jgi:uncharacterized protein involved in exopolysaccharide biosynthesis